MDPDIEVILSNHQYADGTLLKIPLMEARQTGQPHPFVVGNEKFREWMDISVKCADAWLDLRSGN
jgi:metallo-beta-lactamase class B